MKGLFTSESVSIGHPDKLADLVSDSVLDAVLSADKQGRVACETLLSARGVTLAGEITTTADIDYEQIARDVLRQVDPEYEAQASFVNHIVEQSPDIAAGIADGGAGDQGLMFGYSTNETPERLPLPIALAHRLIRRLSEVRTELTYLKADAKSQVTVDYSSSDPVVDTVVISTRHEAGADLRQLELDISGKVIHPVLVEYFDNYGYQYINPAGDFIIGGPLADTGLSGRKIIADTYGGWARHGGGAFSGKDPTKVDRSGAYMARYIANHVIEAGLADECEIQLAYAIGVAEPVSVRVDTFGTSKRYTDEEIARAIRETFDMTPRGMVDELDLLEPIYARTAVGGHFGRHGFEWEKTPRLGEFMTNIESEEEAIS